MVWSLLERLRAKHSQLIDVTVAKDGKEAFDLVKQSMEERKYYNLIFMDVQVSEPVIGPRMCC